ncbi:MAG: RNA polymerase sigma factor [Planctomycetota bacterium]
MSGHDVPIADLLIHADFVRSLARDLVGDAGAADDLAQEAWVRALESPPRHGAALRGWFATLLANLLHNRRRADRRRRAREQAVAAMPPPAVPTPERILEREQARERLVHAVLRLDEPFRTAVLLRYYEDLPTPEIARRLGVPAATVRTRLARGMQRLRELLDGEHAGRRSAWVGALTGFALPRPPAVAVATGILAMKKLAIALAAAAAIVFVLTISLFLREDAPPPAPPRTDVRAAVGDAAPEPQAPVGEGDRAAVDRGYEARTVPVMPAERGVGAVFGKSSACAPRTRRTCSSRPCR